MASPSPKTEHKPSSEPTVDPRDPVDEASLKLFPERRGEVKEPSFVDTAIWGHRGVKIQKYKCEKMVADKIENSPLVKTMLSALRSAGCAVDLRRNFSCEHCGPEVTGGYDPTYNQIVVCYNRCNANAVQGVIAHELLHMYDYCRAELDFNNIEHVACTEIRAANLMHCSFMSGVAAGSVMPLNPMQAHQKCVKQKAVASVLAVRPQMEKRKAWDIVDKVFDKCYNDLEPVGRRIRRASGDMERVYRERHRYGYW